MQTHVQPPFIQEVAPWPEDVHCGLSEDPAGVRVIPRHNAHADAQVPVATEQVDGASEMRLLLADDGSN